MNDDLFILFYLMTSDLNYGIFVSQCNQKRESKESSSIESIDHSKHLLSTIKKDIFGNQDDYISIDKVRKETCDDEASAKFENVKLDLQMTENTIYDNRPSLELKSSGTKANCFNQLHEVKEIIKKESSDEGDVDGDECEEEETLMKELNQVGRDESQRGSLSSFISFSQNDSHRNSKALNENCSSRISMINHDYIPYLNSTNSRTLLPRQSYTQESQHSLFPRTSSDYSSLKYMLPRQTLNYIPYNTSMRMNGDFAGNKLKMNWYENSTSFGNNSTNNTINNSQQPSQFNFMKCGSNVSGQMGSSFASSKPSCDQNGAISRPTSNFSSCTTIHSLNNISIVDFNNFEDLVRSVPNIPTFVNSQKGSRSLQKSLSLFSQEEISSLYELVFPFFNEIINNSFGNYFCQKLFKQIETNQRIKTWNFFKLQTLIYATNEHGNHCFQSMIESLTDPLEEIIVMGTVKPYLKELAYNQHGTHILQKIILKFSESGKACLVHFLKENFLTLACDAQGVCLIKKYIISLNGACNSVKSDFINQIYGWIPKLINDNFGNYAVLCIIDEWKLGPCDKLIKIFEKNLAMNSAHKFASTLVQRAFDLMPIVSKLFILLNLGTKAMFCF